MINDKRNKLLSARVSQEMLEFVEKKARDYGIAKGSFTTLILFTGVKAFIETEKDAEQITLQNGEKEVKDVINRIINNKLLPSYLNFSWSINRCLIPALRDINNFQFLVAGLREIKKNSKNKYDALGGEREE